MRTLVCLGAGRLAHHLMPALEHAGCEVVQVFNRTESAALILANRLGASAYTSDPAKIRRDADAYFLTIADDAIASVARQVAYLENDNAIFIHCSGVLPMDILPFQRRGVFYPLQTFSPGHHIPWKTTPLLITASRADILDELRTVAQNLSNAVYEISDQDKTFLHLAAVFANNFTNHMLTLAERLCRQHQVPFDILKPLIRETFEKALEAGPSHSQTGPAIRGDEKTLEKHIQLLADLPALQDLYRLMTHSIRSSSSVSE